MTKSVLVRDTEADPQQSFDPGFGGASRWVGPFKTNCYAAQQMEETLAGSVDGGTFTVTHDGDTTPALAWNVSAANLKTALEALPSIGAGNVRTVTGPDVNSGYIIQFVGLTATEMLSTNSASLTGPDAPYVVAGLRWGAEVPLVTLAAGDMLEDFYWLPVEAFDTSVLLDFCDQKELDDSSGWTSSDAQGTFALDTNEASGAAFSNFRTTGGGSQSTVPTVSQQNVAQWISASDVSAFAILPLIARNEVVIYARTIDLPSPPTQGELWVWVKLATPEAI